MSFASNRMTQCRGFLARLRRDTRGNTLAMVGAALIPLSAMIGSGIDMSRAYMARSRLQNACDSAALAARRVLVNDTLTDAVIAEARRYFNFNFNQGQYETSPFVVNVTKPATGTIRVTANTNIPTSIMRLFGFDTLPLSITCDASMNFVNTDVMLVLDVTGSMDSTIGGVRKIESLRSAVMALYDELAPIQTQLESNGLRLRYGVVPYSSTVNVGNLVRGVNAAYISSNSEYQTRVANYSTPVYEEIPGTPEAPVEQIYGSSIDQNDCDRYGRNRDFGSFNSSPTQGGGPAPAATWRRTFSNNEASGVDWGWSGAPDTSGTNRSCRRRYVETDSTWVLDGYRFTNWSYEAEVLNTTNFKTGASVTYATSDPSTGNPGGTMEVAGTYDMLELAEDGTDIYTSSTTWTGCIEERDTLNTIIPSADYTIPSGAYDLNVNYIPDSDTTRWRPMWRQLVYRRTAGSTSATSGTSMSGAACPAEARRLQAWTRANLLTYVTALTPTGSTYHDTGMIWGARMISPNGVFADSPDTYAGMPVSRHIIFMSDGQMDTANDTYSLYGVERNSQRISGMPDPSENELNGRHMQRFKMMCNAAKSQNVSIWVIAFGTTLSAEMLECASNANQASTATDQATLIARFREIGSQIGALRLTQ